MTKSAKQQSFFGGVATLATAVLIVKFISALYKIPLANLLDAEGMGHFTVAYNVFNVLLTLATAGLPLALSKMTSEALARGQGGQMRRQFRVALAVFAVLGLAAAGSMFFFAESIAAAMNDSAARYPIQVLAPAVFFVCLLGACRGYTQGRGIMTPTAVSQILEALVKLFVGLAMAAYVLLALHAAPEIGAAAAIFGVTVSAAAAAAYLLLWVSRHRLTLRCSDTPPRRREILSRLLHLGVPITLGAGIIAVITVVNQSVVMGRLENALGLSESAAAELYGQYTFGLNLFNFPASFVYPVTISLIPAVSAALARREQARCTILINSSFRLVALMALPAGVGLSVLAEPILQLLYFAVPETAAAATWHLQILGVASIFTCLMVLCNGVLQACGRVQIPVFTALVGGAVNVAAAWLLCGNAAVGVRGASLATLACYGLIALLDLIAVHCVLPEKPRYLRLFAKPALATLLMALCARGIFAALTRLALPSAVSVLAAAGLAAGVYFALIPALGMVTREDLSAFSKGEKIASFLHIR